ncbi:MAG TPA: S9 family peptidase [Candidatus Limnocylindrales bacterium]|nr:S9 family peptidase [Candidatus Limnocylindrales bacterium]
MMKTKRAFGTWDSPLRATELAGAHRLQDIQFGEAGAAVVWLESRAGQTTLIMQRDGDAPRELTGRDTTLRGGVGYGGGEFTVQGDTIVYTGNGKRLYVQSLAGGRARPITPAFGAAVSPRLSPDGRWVAFVHSDENTDGLALVDVEGADFPRKLAYGTDFVMQPAWHPSGDRLACLVWNQPHMPWDGTELRLLTLGHDGRGLPYVIAQDTLAGGEDISVFQPEFSPDGRWLSYVSDESGWWRLYVRDLATGAVRLLTPDEAEYGGPAWIQGLHQYGWAPDSAAIYALRNQNSLITLWRITVPDGTAQRIDLPPYTWLRQLAVSPTHDRLALFAAGPTTPERALLLDFEAAPPFFGEEADGPGLMAADGTLSARVIRRTSTETLTEAELSDVRPIQWTGPDGEVVHGNFYPPASDRFEGVGLPPLIVHVHGGPTSQAPLAYSDEMQFFATRGFAVLQVNHRGSTGYGKAYRDKHRLNWGGPDVEDASSGAAHLAEEGLVDANKCVILGGSAGGYTVLQSLVDKPGFWKAGVCLYGISNQFTLVSEGDWKFEQRYSDMLLGPLPESAQRYRDRSPLFHAERIVDPVIIFQGEDDVVVPRSQSDSIVAVLAQRGVPHEYHVYAGEGHGWRKPETIEAYLAAALKFLEKWVIYA